jgi:hypothetical protein
MTAVWQRVGRWLLVAAICLVALTGSWALPASGESCAELVANGGFETDGAWEFGATPVPPEYVTSTSHAGSRSLQLGIPEGENIDSYSSAKQPVTLPADATEATVTFWVSAVVGADPGADKMQFVLLDARGDTLAVIWSSHSDNPTWSQLTYDLTPWRGQAVQLYFNAYNDGVGGTTGMFLDDVSLVVCPDSGQAADTAVPVPPEASQPPPVDSAEIAPAAVETPALIFLTPGVDVEPDGPQTFPAPQEMAPGEAPLPGSETPPALIFFTPTAGEGSSASSPETGSTAQGSGGIGTVTPQITVVSLVVTPLWTAVPKPSQVNSAPLATRSTVASGAPPNEGRFTQWPKGWWFAAAAVFAVILAAGLFAWRR